MEEGRNKTLRAIVEDCEKKADEIIEDFSEFMDGTRVLLLLWRHKEGGATNEYRRRRAREVTHDMDQMRKALIKLLLLQQVATVDMRIYMSMCPRDLRKAEMEFKSQMLDMDFAGETNKTAWWKNLEEKWISSLMSANPVKDRSLFLLDIDQPDNAGALHFCSRNNVEIVKVYKTKNGWHMVVKPFNRTLFPAEVGSVHDDGLLLLSY